MSIYYQDDAVTLHHGDCLEILDWLEADVLVTDPPYGMAFTQGRRVNGQSSAWTSRWTDVKIAGDDTTQARDEVLGFMGQMLESAASDHALKTAALALHFDTWHSDMACPPAVTRAISALERLVALGRESGSLRPDLDSSDLMLLASTGPFDYPPHARERWLELVRPGLLPQL